MRFAFAFVFLVLLAGCIQPSAAPPQAQPNAEPSVAVPPVVEPPAGESPAPADANAPANQPQAAPTLDENLTVFFLDVGQGDSIIVQQGDKAVLIDAGDNGKGSSVVVPFLQDHHISQLSSIIATHPHADHLGGIDEVIDANISFDSFLGYLDGCTTKSCADVQARVARKTVALSEGDFLEFPLPFEVLSPPLPLPFPLDQPNNNSVVLLLSAGNVSFLFTGDCEQPCEARMLQDFPVLHATILKAGHHGSRTSSSPAFLHTVQPEITVISAGAGNSYGHPHQETLENLSARNIAVYRTDLQGTIAITTDGVNYTVLTETGTLFKDGKSS